MVYTMTTNPTLDYMMPVQNFRVGETNRSIGTRIVAGGKGLNVAIVLKNFGIPVRTFAVTAGFTGQEWIRQVQQLGIDAGVVELESGLTRINVKLNGVEETEVNADGPKIGPEKEEELLALAGAAGAGDWFCLSGKPLPGMKEDIYARMLEGMNDRGVKTVLDASGEHMRSALSTHPYLIKPNLKELAEIGNTSIDGEEDVLHCAKLLIRMGAQNVLVSGGAKGAWWIGRDGQKFHVDAPKGRVRNTVGSGDTMVAAFVYGAETGMKLPEILRLSVAAGSAGAFAENLVTKEEVYAILEDTQIREIH